MDLILAQNFYKDKVSTISVMVTITFGLVVSKIREVRVNSMIITVTVHSERRFMIIIFIE